MRAKSPQSLIRPSPSDKINYALPKPGPGLPVGGLSGHSDAEPGAGTPYAPRAGTSGASGIDPGEGKPMSETATPVKGAGKSRKELDRAVIRFAGDSGDGMQLTGEQFTTESAWAGNDLATLAELPRRDPRPGRDAVRRLELPAPVREPARLHAGRSSGLPGRDESGRAQGPPGRPQARRSAHRQHGRLREAQPRQGRATRQSARRSRAGRALSPAQGRHDRR